MHASKSMLRTASPFRPGTRSRTDCRSVTGLCSLSIRGDFGCQECASGTSLVYKPNDLRRPPAAHRTSDESLTALNRLTISQPTTAVSLGFWAIRCASVDRRCPKIVTFHVFQGALEVCDLTCAKLQLSVVPKSTVFEQERTDWQ